MEVSSCDASALTLQSDSFHSQRRPAVYQASSSPCPDLSDLSPSSLPLSLPGSTGPWAPCPSGEEPLLKLFPVYDLSGRRIAHPTQGGIYIRGGKKVVVK